MKQLNSNKYTYHLTPSLFGQNYGKFWKIFNIILYVLKKWSSIEIKNIFFNYGIDIAENPPPIMEWRLPLDTKRSQKMYKIKINVYSDLPWPSQQRIHWDRMLILNITISR